MSDNNTEVTKAEDKEKKIEETENSINARTALESIYKTKAARNKKGELISGAADFKNLMNRLSKQIEVKADEEKKKPKYRFLRNETNSTIARLESSKLQTSIYEHNYEVFIYEDLDCKDVTKENKYFIRICDTAGVHVDIDLLWYEEKIKDFEFNEQDYIENVLSKITGCINNEVREVSKAIVDYLAYIIYLKEVYILKYSKIGWEYIKINGERKEVPMWIFKYDHIYSQNNFRLKGELPESLADGLRAIEDEDSEKEFEWVSHTIKLLNQYDYDALILGAGISGLVRQLLNLSKETNININIKGGTGTGKTTIGRYLLSIFGNPEKIEGSFIDTSNSMEEIRVKRPVLPYVLDERMLRVALESEKKKQQEIMYDVFREYEGKGKERIGKQYEDTAGERIYGPIISSSVDSMVDYLYRYHDIGQFRRFIELEIGGDDSKLFNSSEEAIKTGNISQNNYGIGIKIILEYMIWLLEDNSKEAETIRDTFNNIVEIVNRLLLEREKEENSKGNNVKGLQSSATRFALIIVSYQVLRESLLYYTFNKLKDLNYDDSDINDIDINSEQEKIDKAIIYKDEQKVGIDSTFKDFLDNIRNEKVKPIIVDKTTEIAYILIENLVEKIDKIKKLPNEQVNRIYDYIIKNKKHFKTGDKFTPNDMETIIKSNGDILGFCVINDDTKTIDLYTLEEYYLAPFIYSNPILEPDKLVEYMKYVDEHKLKGKEAVEKYGANTYETNLNNPGYDMRSYKTINGERRYFHKFTVHYVDAQNQEEDSKE